jgi:hypothetical protein
LRKSGVPQEWKPFEPDPVYTGVGKRRNFRFSETIREAVIFSRGFLRLTAQLFIKTGKWYVNRIS